MPVALLVVRSEGACLTISNGFALLLVTHVALQLVSKWRDY